MVSPPLLSVPSDVVIIVVTNHIFMGALFLAQIKALCQGLHQRPSWPPKAIILAFIMTITALSIQGSWMLFFTSSIKHIDIKVSILGSFTRFIAVMLLSVLSSYRAIYVLNIQSLKQTWINKYQLGMQVYLLMLLVNIAAFIQFSTELTYQYAALKRKNQAWVDQKINWSLHTFVSTLAAFTAWIFVCFFEGYVSVVMVSCNPFNTKNGLLPPPTNPNASYTVDHKQQSTGLDSSPTISRSISSSSSSSSSSYNPPHIYPTLDFHRYVPGSRAYCNAITMSRFRLVRAFVTSFMFGVHFAILLYFTLNLAKFKHERVFAPLDMGSWAMVLCRILEFGEEFDLVEVANESLSIPTSTNGFDSSFNLQHDTYSHVYTDMKTHGQQQGNLRLF